jgi:hypothetical protein
LKISSLSLLHRSLTGQHSASENQLASRELAARLISLSHLKINIEEGFAFIRSICPESLLAIPDEHLIIPLIASNRPLADNLKLPKSCGFKGGTARELLCDKLGLRNFRAPRDLDLVRRGSFHTPQDELVAREFMPHDYRHGARVELIRSISRYLSSRDITINEVCAFHAEINVSLLGALDAAGNVIRPSRYRGGSIHRQPGLDGKIFLKMVRLFAEAEHFGDSSILVGIPDTVIFSEIDLAINLDKAFQRGHGVAQLFISTLIHLGALDASDDPLAQVLEELEHLRHGELNLLPHAPPL